MTAYDVRAYAEPGAVKPSTECNEGTVAYPTADHGKGDWVMARVRPYRAGQGWSAGLVSDVRKLERVKGIEPSS